MQALPKVNLQIVMSQYVSGAMRDPCALMVWISDHLSQHAHP